MGVVTMINQRTSRPGFAAFPAATSRQWHVSRGQGKVPSMWDLESGIDGRRSLRVMIPAAQDRTCMSHVYTV